MTTTVSEQAVELRDRLRRLANSIEDQRRTARLDDIADKVEAASASARSWLQVAHAFGQTDFPFPLLLPTVSEVKELQRMASSEGLRSATNVRDLTRKMDAIRVRLQSTESSLRDYCVGQCDTIVANISQRVNAAQAALHPDLANQLSRCGVDLIQALKTESPPPERVRATIASLEKLTSELDHAFERGSPELRAFLAEAATVAGATLVQLTAELLEELKASKLAGVLKVRIE